MLDDHRFIRQRSNEAAETYERIRKQGADVFQALELAHAVLYQDLRFSRYDAIFQVVSEWFPEVKPKERTTFCLRILPVCEPVFARYNPGDDFETSPLYRNMETELIGAIQQHIEKNGIQ